MKKYIKTVILMCVMAGLCVGYFYYLSTHEPSVETSKKKAADNELTVLLTKDINAAYPESPKEVVKLEARIIKACYTGNVSNDDLNKLAEQERLLFDNELKKSQTDSDFSDALKNDVESYKSLNRTITGYTIDDAAAVDYKTFMNRKYAFVYMTYNIRQGDKITASRTKYTLRCDENNNWKILYWELAAQPAEN